jgi:hypothetical protein
MIFSPKVKIHRRPGSVHGMCFWKLPCGIEDSGLGVFGRVVIAFSSSRGKKIAAEYLSATVNDDRDPKKIDARSVHVP